MHTCIEVSLSLFLLFIFACLLNLEPHTCQASAFPVLTKLMANDLVWYKIIRKILGGIYVTNSTQNKFLSSSLYFFCTFVIETDMVQRDAGRIQTLKLIVQSLKNQKDHVSLQNLLMVFYDLQEISVWRVHTKSTSCGIQLHSWHSFLIQHRIHVDILYKV